MKKLLKPLALLSFLGLGLSLASCGNTSLLTTTATKDPGTETTTNYNEEALKFLANGKVRIDFKLEGVTLKLNGNAVTSGSVLDIPSTFNLTADGKPNADFYCYIATVTNNTIAFQALDEIEKDKIDDFLAEIVGDVTKNVNKAYIAITTVKGGWTKGLDAKMDAGFESKITS